MYHFFYGILFFCGGGVRWWWFINVVLVSCVPVVGFTLFFSLYYKRFALVLFFFATFQKQVGGALFF